MHDLAWKIDIKTDNSINKANIKIFYYFVNFPLIAVIKLFSPKILYVR